MDRRFPTRVPKRQCHRYLLSLFRRAAPPLPSHSVEGFAFNLAEKMEAIRNELP